MYGILEVLAIGLAVLVLLAVVVVYYILVVRAILQALRRKTNQVLLVFMFLSLVPVPPCILMGVMILIIWHTHKRDLSDA